jgi:rhomboid protease GluP
MHSEAGPPPFIEEKRLIKTLITGRPSKTAFLVASLTVMLMTLASFFYWQNIFGWEHFLPAIKVEVFTNSQWWRIFTAIFIHADTEHLLSNMYMLWIFSYFVYGYFGFTVFPFVSFLVAAVVNAFAIMSYAPDMQLLGASGLVYVLGGFWLTMYFFIQRQYSTVNRFMRVTGIALMIFWPTSFAPTTSYRTHALGFVAGIIMAGFYFYKNRQAVRSYEVYKVSYVESEIKY